MYFSIFGLVLDIVGAYLLIKGELVGGAALVNYWASGEMRHNYMERLQRFLFWKRWMLAVAGRFGSKERMREDWVEESLPVKLWGLAFLILGFVFQGLGALFHS